MSFRYLDMEHYERIEHFRYFLSMPYPYAGVTVDIDVTDIVSFCKARGYSFYLTFLHAAAKAADRVPELRRRLKDGQVIQYDRCQPSYTAMRSNGVYVYCLVDSGTLPYEDFIREGREKQREALEREELKETGDFLNHFFVSCLPWLPYTQIQHPSVSRATVYRNLNQLAAQGEILRVPVPTGADRFDFNIKPHYHVRCTKCGGVFDVFMPPVTDLIDRVEDSSGVELHRYEILFVGICSACRKD